MVGYSKKSKGLKVVILTICFLFLVPGLLLADEDPGKVAARKAALNAFFDKSLCQDCHGTTPIYNIRSARAGYDTSGHKNSGNSFYANGGDCIQCHTHEGFIKYGGTGAKIDDKEYIAMPSQQSCFTCHNPHETGDMSLRKTDPVKLFNGKTFNIGKGNLCANCHRSRYDVKATVKALPADKVAGHWGAHHGPQADMLLGNNAHEYPGKKYYNSVHSTLTKNGCAECHMSFPQSRFSYAPDMGGHSFRLVGEVHHEPKLNTAGCLGNCHTKMKQVTAINPDTPVEGFWWHQTSAVFDTEAKADFDNDGKVEPLQSEIEGLMNFFVNKKGTGYLQKGDVPMFKADGTWNWTRSKTMRSEKEIAALWNYKFVAEDRSRGIHNAPYTIQILYDSLKSLDSGFDISKRNVYKPPEEYKAGN
jgi:hypothetical protein